MKNNINNISATDKFQKRMLQLFGQYYREALANRVRKGLKSKKKLSTLQNCYVKRCKV
jgi:hypothetical protein